MSLNTVFASGMENPKVVHRSPEKRSKTDGVFSTEVKETTVSPSKMSAEDNRVSKVAKESVFSSEIKENASLKEREVKRIKQNNEKKGKSGTMISSTSASLEGMNKLTTQIFY